MGSEIHLKTRLQLWNAAIYSIPKYGLCTLKISEAMMIKLHQFCSKCIRNITESDNNSPPHETEQSETNEDWEENTKQTNR